MSEQRPFDAISLNYIFPLISIILRQNGVGNSDADENDEQVTLALEFLSFHTNARKYIGELFLSILSASMVQLIYAQFRTFAYHVAKSSRSWWNACSSSHNTIRSLKTAF